MIPGWPPPVFDPAGPYASSVTWLAWALLAMGAAVTLIVILALWIALRGSDRTRARLGGTKAIWAGGILFPVIVLTILLVWGLSLTRSLAAAPDRPVALRAQIIGEMWWWRVVYQRPDGSPLMVDANELHIPAGSPVVLDVGSADVIHSFWVPRLSGKVDMVPGRWNRLTIQADQPGIYGGQCAEYCGGPHALMGLVVVAHRPEDFRAFVERRTARLAGAAPAADPAAARLFDTAGCAACHRIAGSGHNGLAGPDLTFVGDRRTLGAGILPNNRGTLMGWIGNSQAIKPHNRMPPYTNLSGAQLTALAAYLEAQK